MWAVVIVVGAPCRNQMAGMAQGWEQVLVQMAESGLSPRIRR